MFELDGTRRRDGVDTIEMCSDDLHTVIDIRTGDSFMLVEPPRRGGVGEWRILFGGHMGTIHVSNRELGSLRLVAWA